MYGEEYGQLATPGEAHREWHLNSGVPMGTPGCPQDACHPVEEDDGCPWCGEAIGDIMMAAGVASYDQAMEAHAEVCEAAQKESEGRP